MAGAAIHGLTQKVNHLRGEVGRDSLADLRLVGKDWLAVGIDNPLYQGRRHLQAVVGENPVRRGHLQYGDFGDAQDNALVGPYWPSKTQAVGYFDDAGRTDEFGDLYGRGVGRAN